MTCPPCDDSLTDPEPGFSLDWTSVGVSCKCRFHCRVVTLSSSVAAWLVAHGAFMLYKYLCK